MYILFAIGRVLLVLIFIVSGATKLLDIHGTAAQIEPVVTIPDFLEDTVDRLEDMTNMKWPQLIAVLGGVIEVVGGLLVAFNIATRGAAAVLALFTLVTTFYFWHMSGEAVQNNMIEVLKNLSITGGLLTLVVLGSWRPLRPSKI